ncbi:VOC family protein [Croceicoccus sp. YJ47]|uniref:VOC family protein n=1 Tax=Croceicoccus sp. YJ47 TaxID=2798724 RepID=UPI0019217FD4|nr:VOC family protein [Croceicoccus sp. YJ47]QQN74180.1 VOC family protein [Croceicoccus sp. YJ47]
MTQFVSPDTLRARFSAAMSAMYRAEVPLYGELLDIVAAVNARTGGPAARVGGRLGEERHGAIRVGTAAELRAMRRFFDVMGMEPVDYYDLSVVSVPVHSTAFRPITAEGMEANPFRMFCSLLRLELIEDAELRDRAAGILEARQICSTRLMHLIAKAEETGGLAPGDADAFLEEGLNVFRWHDTARVDAQTYGELHDAHRLIADVVSFAGPHINHLTPRTLDIDAAQAEMIARNIDAKDQIEGPPRRACPILLRQTSFKALSETVSFGGDNAGAHTARFGEIEQRGAALTPKGRALYDECLADARAARGDYEAALRESFARFPDDLDAMREDALAFFRGGNPVTYEDFLPVSAAGIFQSNLGAETSNGHGEAGSARDAFEDALGMAVHDPFALYRAGADAP